MCRMYCMYLPQHIPHVLPWYRRYFTPDQGVEYGIMP